MLQGKKIIVGVCGSIAAYKSAYLIRQIIQKGAEVKVIMTTSASDFITPLTLSTVSKNPVYHSFQKDVNSGEWNNHVELGLWADGLVIAPATANTMAKMASGFCDNLLLATYLSARCPVFLAPAMDLDMYVHPSTRHNLDKLRDFGNRIIEAEHGQLASGLIGTGRMAEPDHIINLLESHFSKKKELEGKRILITAGPTYEAIDPVRFIGNHSSGKMGFALAEEMASRGAVVNLISGPTHLQISHRNVKVTRVSSAQSMYEECKILFPNSDIAVLSAAVADYKPAIQLSQKMKKNNGSIKIDLEKTVDIAQELGKLKKKGQIIIGFALETENEKSNAQEKLKKKNFDFIVLNSLNDSGAGFGHDTNKISIIRNKDIKEFGLKSKAEVAKDIADEVIIDLNA